MNKCYMCDCTFTKGTILDNFKICKECEDNLFWELILDDILEEEEE